MIRHIDVRTFIIPTLSIPAAVHGDFAIHRTVTNDPDKIGSWTLTHVPSGLMMLVTRQLIGCRMALRMLKPFILVPKNNDTNIIMAVVVGNLISNNITVLFPNIINWNIKL